MDLLREDNSSHTHLHRRRDHHHIQDQNNAIGQMGLLRGESTHHRDSKCTIGQMDLQREEASSSSPPAPDYRDSDSTAEQQLDEIGILIEHILEDADSDSKRVIQQLHGMLSASQAEKKAWLAERDLLSSRTSQLAAEKHSIQLKLDAAITAQLDLEDSLCRMSDRCTSLERENVAFSEKVHPTMTVVPQLGDFRQQSGHPADGSDLKKPSTELSETELDAIRARCRANAKDENAFHSMVQSMDMELFNKADALARSCETVIEAGFLHQHSNEMIAVLSSSSDDTNACRPGIKRLQFLEEQVQTRDNEINKLKDRIRDLELSIEELEIRAADSQAEQLKDELIRLQKRNSNLVQREQELLSTVRTESVLQEEIQVLQEENDFLGARLSKVLEAAQDPHLLEKVAELEQELMEAMEVNNMYKSQLTSLLEENSGKECGRSGIGKDEWDQVLGDLVKHKQKAAKLEEELNDIHVEYSHMSLKFAQAETERGELILIIKKLENQLAETQVLCQASGTRG